jgi:hypothetical protein
MMPKEIKDKITVKCKREDRTMVKECRKRSQSSSTVMFGIYKISMAGTWHSLQRQ